MASINRLVVTKGVDNEFIFTIKARSGIYPLPIAGYGSITAATVDHYPNTTIYEASASKDAVPGVVRIYTKLGTLYSKPVYTGSTMVTGPTTTAILSVNTFLYSTLSKSDTPPSYGAYGAKANGDVYSVVYDGTTSAWGNIKKLYVNVSGTVITKTINVNNDDVDYLNYIKSNLPSDHVGTINGSALQIEKTGLTITGSNEFTINMSTSGEAGTDYATNDHVWLYNNVARVKVGAEWMQIKVSVVVDGITIEVPLDYNRHVNNNLLLNDINTAIKARFADAVVSVVDNYVEVHSNYVLAAGGYSTVVTISEPEEAEAQRDKSFVTKATSEVDISILNRLGLKVNTLQVTTSLGTVQANVSKDANGLFPDRITISGLSTDKQSTLPKAVITFKYTLSGTDSFIAQIYEYGTDNLVMSRPLSVVDASNGKVKLELSASDVAGFNKEQGTFADRYYPKATYKLVLVANTNYDGNFVSHVGNVYVK